MAWHIEAQRGCGYNYEAYHGVRHKKPLEVAFCEVMKQKHLALLPWLPVWGDVTIQVSGQLGIHTGLRHQQEVALSTWDVYIIENPMVLAHREKPSS